MVKFKETIFALSTPPGKAAVALIRISGPLSYGCIKKFSSNMPIKPNASTYNEIRTKDGLLIDQSITTFFKAPKSFTGEDMVEIAVHGSNAVIKKILSLLAENNSFRVAKPGEFTRRAFENNKLDLTQVEAIADIVSAETEMQRKQAISHLSGNFFTSTKKIFENLKKTLANIEAIIDFSEEDLPENLMNEIKEQIENNIILINKILEGSSLGISIRNGFLIAILGKPNTGKSSFINRISGRDVAIVTDQPGTTRDLIESFIDLDGAPVKFVDTAGIRRSLDLVEKIGVKKALTTSKEADINLIFIEKSNDMLDFKNIKNPIFVKSKQDVFGGIFCDNGYYNISSKNEFGIKELLNLIKEKIHDKIPNENIYISRERQLKCLILAKEELEKSKEDKTVDLFAEDIRFAIKNMSALFGNVDIEDILDIVFADFCIGK
ncbi:tRNA uridine-5-carboxymethylaminomethyl(34) synthesis GTPase MnmE [Alphaproteobacteria bacterium]|nr:tRNA uridine-5-carboxymethylaminomethyl(34) synthesis GTPase MnmE [Alphaproteobacteria bacterium]